MSCKIHVATSMLMEACEQLGYEINYDNLWKARLNNNNCSSQVYCQQPIKQ